ncbi:MAG: AraC family transcriptional regulator [Candidatus Wallbacteria bacterium HGW-Wallbacteria-1]|jgi:transcriptional regulator GlxA family with amidase domain|uniref:AraC family transcriptional regulator n=1 Tax=Candidatus Wallbacteria bacterium HGW-Wallbacteria-1 TaxID=2013854 RepID=A0A2N1PIU1_9BACT|nr:MAG: AraC family transcriptional regulator [Candidatus Wallbacteria bacterium HGW-Wallbacteria-1]
MADSEILIAIANYPGALQSSVYGLQEMFLLSNSICQSRNSGVKVSSEIVDFTENASDSVSDGASDGASENDSNSAFPSYNAVIIPPGLDPSHYSNPDQKFVDWILRHHASGAIICSACAGTFILASSGILDGRAATTHWGLAALFAEEYPQVRLDIGKILINEGDVITAGGLMSWIDLGLELVAELVDAGVMRQLGKLLVVDTGQREQRYYESFIPRMNHGDQIILSIQNYMNEHFHESITISSLAESNCLSQRTFLRRFIKATGLTPISYLQRIRIQNGCDLIETTDLNFDQISLKVGYEDISAFRKIFVRILGLTPGEFRSRFVGAHACGNLET